MPNHPQCLFDSVQVLAAHGFHCNQFRSNKLIHRQRVQCRVDSITDLHQPVMKPPEPRDRHQLWFTDDEHPCFDRSPKDFCRNDHRQASEPVSLSHPVHGQKLEWKQNRQR